MRLRLLIGAALSAALLAGCSQPQAAQPTPERPFQVTPIPATAGPSSAFGSGSSYPYPSPQAGAATAQEGAYPGPQANPDQGSQANDPVVLAQGRTQSALTSLKVAQEIAQSRFKADSQLYAIMPSSVMLANLGGPPVLAGWFYKFKGADSPREYIVQIVDGELSGALETEVINPPTPLEQAIPLDRVTVDSDQVFTQIEQRASQLGISGDPRTFDLELVNLEGSSGPVWNVFEPGTGRWLFTLDATSGADAPNPRG